MELSAYGKIIIVDNHALYLAGEGELAEVNWTNPLTPVGEVMDTDDEKLPSPLATESLVLFFRNIITRQEYFGYTSSRRTFVTIDGVNYEVTL